MRCTTTTVFVGCRSCGESCALPSRTTSFNSHFRALTLYYVVYEVIAFPPPAEAEGDVFCGEKSECWFLTVR
jgi:hypothetical protein